MTNRLIVGFFGPPIQRRHPVGFCAAGMAAVLMLVAPAGLAQQAGAPSGVQEDQRWTPARSSGVIPTQADAIPVNVPLNNSKVLQFRRSIKRVSVGNPAVADILVVRSTQIYVVGKSLGTTNVVLWDGEDRVQGILNVEVTHDLQTLKLRLHELLPRETIQVRSSQGALILNGEVSSAPRMDAALRLARSFVAAGAEEGGGVLNLMQVGGAQQVMLDVKVAEVQRTLVKRLNIQFSAFNSDSPWKIGAVKGGASFPDALFQTPLGEVRLPVFPDGTPLGPMIEELAPTTPTIQDAGIFASYLSGDFLFNMVIDAARNQGLARILAEPNLTTLTGQEARFLAGGEFPIPVPQDLGRVTIEFKEFGVALQFLPVVLDSGVVNLKVNVSVSELVPENSLTVGFGTDVSTQFFVPALVKRSANATVELESGQTIAIAGMINENLRENVDKFPWLGDVPVLGMLFRSQEFVKGQTELVIFVTPRLARPIEPEMVRLPTDGFVEPSDAEFYLMGRLEGRRQSAEAGVGAPVQGGTEGKYGHDL